MPSRRDRARARLTNLPHHQRCAVTCPPAPSLGSSKEHHMAAATRDLALQLKALKPGVPLPYSISELGRLFGHDGMVNADTVQVIQAFAARYRCVLGYCETTRAPPVFEKMLPDGSLVG